MFRRLTICIGAHPSLGLSEENYFLERSVRPLRRPEGLCGASTRFSRKFSCQWPCACDPGKLLEWRGFEEAPPYILKHATEELETPPHVPQTFCFVGFSWVGWVGAASIYWASHIFEHASCDIRWAKRQLWVRQREWHKQELQPCWHLSKHIPWHCGRVGISIACSP